MRMSYPACSRCVAKQWRRVCGVAGLMMPADHTAARIGRVRGLGKDPEPRPRGTSPRVLALQSVRHLHASFAQGLILQPQRMSSAQLLAQARDQALRQHQGPVLAALAGANDQRAVLEVHILDAQLQGLGQAHARPIEQASEKALLTVEATEHGSHLILHKHHRQPTLHARAPDFAHPRQLQAQRLRVEKEQGRQRLLMRGGGHVAIVGQPAQEGFDLRAAHLCGMANPVKAYECATPVDIGLLGAAAVVKQPDALAEPIQHLGRTQRRQRMRSRRGT